MIPQLEFKGNFRETTETDETLHSEMLPKEKYDDFLVGGFNPSEKY